MIRKALKDDSLNIAKLIISGWQTAYKGLIDENALKNMSIQEAKKGWEKLLSLE